MSMSFALYSFCFYAIFDLSKIQNSHHYFPSKRLWKSWVNYSLNIRLNYLVKTIVVWNYNQETSARYKVHLFQFLVSGVPLAHS